MVKNLPYNAGDVGSVPGRGTKIPHAAGQLSLHTTTPELGVPQREPACRKLRSPRAVEPARRDCRAHAPWSLRPTATEPMCPGAHESQLERVNPHATIREKPACRN